VPQHCTAACASMVSGRDTHEFCLRIKHWPTNAQDKGLTSLPVEHLLAKSARGQPPSSCWSGKPPRQKRGQRRVCTMDGDWLPASPLLSSSCLSSWNDTIWGLSGVDVVGMEKLRLSSGALWRRAPAECTKCAECAECADSPDSHSGPSVGRDGCRHR